MFGLFSRKKSFTARINLAGPTIEVKANDNLLRAALDTGLAWPHNCRVGSCGSCRCRLVSGKIKPLNDFSYVLDKEELDQGMILACQTRLRSDIVVEVKLDATDEAVSQALSVPGVISNATPLTHDILEIRIRLAAPLPLYLAGQYAQLSVAGIEQPRSYSFANAPENETPNHVTFHVRLVPGGEMSGWLHAENRVGSEVMVAGPYGSFYLREGDAPILCIAGGSGMAPIKALLEHLSHRGFNRPVMYLFGARTQQDLYCLDQMEGIKAASRGHFRFLPILSHEPDKSDWDGLRGFVTQFISEQGLDLPGCQAYLCGPPPMIDSALDEFANAGLASDRIFFDKFLDASHLPGGKR